jgi:integrase
MTPETPETPAEQTATGIDMAALRALLEMQPKPMAWAKFIAQIDFEYRPPMCSRAHHVAFRRTAGELERLGVETTFDLTAELIAKYIATCPSTWSPWTLKAALVRIRTIVNQAMRRRLLIVSPFAIIPIGKIVRLGKIAGKRHLTRPEIARIFEVLNGDVGALEGWGQWKARRLLFVFAFGLYTGLRKLELLRLHMADIDLATRVIRVAPHNATGRLKSEGSEAPVPIAEALAPIIQEWLAHRLDHPRGLSIDRDCPWLVPTCNRKAPWTSGYPGSKPLDRLKAAALRAGVPDITMHMLRRSCATHLEGAGVPRSIISRILRHADVKVTEKHYLRADEQTMVDAVKDFSF